MKKSIKLINFCLALGMISGCQSTDIVQQLKVDLPEMVYIPDSEFIQGDLSSLIEQEVPAHNVNVKEFYISTSEVTRQQWNECVSEDKCRTEIGEGNSFNMPVTNISRLDIEAYLLWLSDKTGEYFRLPTESEWEYAARASSVATYSTTSETNEVCKFANVLDSSAILLNDESQPFQCHDGEPNLNIVKNYLPNAYGLYDMLGNVSEITEDCWHENYNKAPEDGQAWGSKDRGDCTKVVVKGGSFRDGEMSTRVSSRTGLSEVRSNGVTGFRVVQEVDKPFIPFRK